MVSSYKMIKGSLSFINPCQLGPTEEGSNKPIYNLFTSAKNYRAIVLAPIHYYLLSVMTTAGSFIMLGLNAYINWNY